MSEAVICDICIQNALTLDIFVTAEETAKDFADVFQ